MRADVLALREIIRNRPFAGIGFVFAVLAAISLTSYVIAGPQSSSQLAALADTGNHVQNTFR